MKKNKISIFINELERFSVLNCWDLTERLVREKSFSLICRSDIYGNSRRKLWRLLCANDLLLLVIKVFILPDRFSYDRNDSAIVEPVLLNYDRRLL